MAQTIYATRPPKPKLIIVRSTHRSLISVGSVPKYSPIPPHTPDSILFTLDL